MIHTARRKRYHNQLLSQDRQNCSIALAKGLEQPLRTQTPNTPEHARHKTSVSPNRASSDGEQKAREHLQNEIHKGELLSASGAYKKALKVYLSLLELLSTNEFLSLPERVHLRGLVHMNLAWIYHQQHKDYSAALKHYTEAIECLEPMCFLKEEGIFSALMISYRQRSQIKQYLGDIEGALQDLKQSATRQQDLKAPFHDAQEILDDWLGLANYQIELKYWLAAIESLTQAEELLGSENLSALASQDQEQYQRTILGQRAQLLEHLEQPLAALETYDKLLHHLEQSQQALLWARYALLRSVLAFSLPEHEHSKDLKKILAVLQNLEQDNIERQELVLPMLGLAELCKNTAHNTLKTQALDFYALTIRCLERTRQARDAYHEAYLIEAYAGRGVIYHESGDLSKARAAFRQAQRLAQKMSNIETLADLNLKLALVYQAMGKSQEAFEILTETITLLEPFSKPQTTSGSLPEDHILVRALYLRGFISVIERQALTVAIQDFEAVETLCPGLAIYDIACLYTKTGAIAEAFKALQQHLSSDYALSKSEIEADSDLESLHNDPRWADLWT